LGLVRSGPRFLAQVFKHGDHRHAANELGNETELDEIDGLHVFEHVDIATVRIRRPRGIFSAMFFLGDEAHGFGGRRREITFSKPTKLRRR